MHPGIYVSPSLWPLFSLTVPYGMRRTNSAVNHREAAQHMGTICITGDRNLSATFKSYTKILPPPYKYLKAGEY